MYIDRIYNTKWRHLTKVSNPGFYHYYRNFSMLIRTSLEELLNKIDKSSETFGIRKSLGYRVPLFA